jgi:hypothetical protein
LPLWAAVGNADRVANQFLSRYAVAPIPQTVQTLLLTCVAWFNPVHALDATTGQCHSAEAAELSSAAETAWVASDWPIDQRIDGTLQSMRGTADHPVYVPGGDTFQALATLPPGDAVRALDGRPNTVVPPRDPGDTNFDRNITVNGVDFGYRDVALPSREIRVITYRVR